MVRNIADAYPHHPWTWVCRRFLEQVLPPSDDPDDLEKSIAGHKGKIVIVDYWADT